MSTDVLSWLVNGPDVQCEGRSLCTSLELLGVGVRYIYASHTRVLDYLSFV